MNKEQLEKMAGKARRRTKHGRLEPRVNCYVCNECGDMTFTVDCAEGTTPFTLPCMRKSSILDVEGRPSRPCKGYGMSSMYSLTPSDYEWPEDITHEWYAPSLGEYEKIKKNKSRAVLDHVTQGGLLLRERTGHPVLTHGDEFIDHNGDLLSDDDDVASLRTGFERLRVATELMLSVRKKKERIREDVANKKRAKARSLRKERRKARRR